MKYTWGAEAVTGQILRDEHELKYEVDSVTETEKAR